MFKVGDRVERIAGNSMVSAHRIFEVPLGTEGTVYRLPNDARHHCYVKFDNGFNAAGGFWNVNLKPAFDTLSYVPEDWS